MEVIMDRSSYLSNMNSYETSPPFWCFSVPEIIDGKTFTATVVGLNPWVEYEFRTVAANVIGIGEPSRPSEKRRTEEARE